MREQTIFCVKVRTERRKYIVRTLITFFLILNFSQLAFGQDSTNMFNVSDAPGEGTSPTENLPSCEGAQNQVPSVNTENFVDPVVAATQEVIADDERYPFSRPIILSENFHTPQKVCEHAKAQGKPYAFILLKTHHCDSRMKVCATSLTAVAHKANTFVQNNFSLYQTRFYDTTMYGRQVDIPNFQKIADAWNKKDRNPEMVVMDTSNCEVLLREKFYSSRRGGKKLFGQHTMEGRIDAVMTVLANTPRMQNSFSNKRIPFDYYQEKNNISQVMRSNRYFTYLNTNHTPMEMSDLLIKETSKQHRERLKAQGIEIPNRPTTNHMDPGLNGNNNF